MLSSIFNVKQCSFLSEYHNFHPTIPISSFYRKSREEYGKRLGQITLPRNSGNNEKSKNLGNGYKQIADIMCQGRDMMWRVLIGYYKHQICCFCFVTSSSKPFQKTKLQEENKEKHFQPATMSLKKDKVKVLNCLMKCLGFQPANCRFQTLQTLGLEDTDMHT